MRPLEAPQELRKKKSAGLAVLALLGVGVAVLASRRGGGGGGDPRTGVTTGGAIDNITLSQNLPKGPGQSVSVNYRFVVNAVDSSGQGIAWPYTRQILLIRLSDRSRVGFADIARQNLAPGGHTETQSVLLPNDPPGTLYEIQIALWAVGTTPDGQPDAAGVLLDQQIASQLVEIGGGVTGIKAEFLATKAFWFANVKTTEDAEAIFQEAISDRPDLQHLTWPAKTGGWDFYSAVGDSLDTRNGFPADTFWILPDGFVFV